MAFGFPANHIEEFPFGGPDDWRMGWIRHTIRAKRWTIKAESATSIKAVSSANLLTWGEMIEVELVGPHTIVVGSRCRLWTQCIDYGMNQSHVQGFARQLWAGVEAARGSAPAAQQSMAENGTVLG